jgi:hypothetical protein
MLEPEQLWHTAPVEPQLAGTVPGLQVPVVAGGAIRQQPPLQACMAEHTFVHLCVCTLHAWLGAQSAAVEQPQAPATQLRLVGFIVQSLQEVPPVPQPVGDRPFEQVPPLQQPPLHNTVGEQVVEHRCMLGSHA